MTETPPSQIVTVRCYCGATKIRSTAPPKVVARCHCSDCRRVAVFAAFDDAAISFFRNEGRPISMTPSATRVLCEGRCSPVAGRYDYLPDVVYVAIGLLHQANEFPPEVHTHANSRLDWLHFEDDLERFPASALTHLNKKA